MKTTDPGHGIETVEYWAEVGKCLYWTEVLYCVFALWVFSIKSIITWENLFARVTPVGIILPALTLVACVNLAANFYETAEEMEWLTDLNRRLAYRLTLIPFCRKMVRLGLLIRRRWQKR